ncbi:MAG: family 10 glycosylhydrolase [Ignavibacteria bacterium]|nr:family 10 glycosylhydrolase [Ignavibacteria bacterium]MCU7520861.1 family 10 glycosylhydrolase [Ignavibacteria bacterium]
MKKIFYCLLFVLSMSVLSFPQISPKQELRGVWIASLGIDWPSTRGTDAGSISAQKNQLTTIFNQHKTFGLNAIFFHIRPKCDAVYNSSIEPWSAYLTGKQGLAPADPNYDPLQYAVTEAHKRGMELHAWLNPYRVLSLNEDSNAVAPTNVMKKHPEWIIKCAIPSGSTAKYPYTFLNPGIPAVRAYLVNVIMDIVRRYDIDGVHFDDYFYPYTDYGPFNDDATYNTYKGTFTSKSAWRMNNVNLLLAEINDSIKAVKPWIKFGISPSGNPSVNTGIYCDTQGWLQGKYTDDSGAAHTGTSYIDYIMPQLYWVSYNNQLPNWSGASFLNGRHLYIGLPSYRYAESGFSPSELGWEMKTNRTTSTIKGHVFYNSNSLTAKNFAGCTDSLIHNFNVYSAITPKMSWITGSNTKPNAPLNLRAEKNTTSGKYELKWDAPQKAQDGDEAFFYIVYRFESEPTEAMLNDPSKILGTYGETTLPSAFAKYSVTSGNYYVVTAVDRYSNESAMSNVFHMDQPDQIPVTPVLKSPADRTASLVNTATLTWNSVPLAESYVLQIAKDSQFKNVVAYAPEHRKLSFTYNSVAAGIQYYWRVKAAGPGGSSEYSAPFEFESSIMGTPVLSEPKYTAKDVVLNPVFKWARVLSATSYRLQLSADQNYTNIVVDTVVADTAFALAKPLQTGSYYYWHIKAKNASAETGWSARWQFLTTYVSAIKEDRGEKDVQVREYSLKQNYPNPFNPSTVIRYSLAKDTRVKLSVYDMLGNEIAVLVDRYQNAGNHSIEFNADRFSITSGIYFYMLKTNDFVSTRKMIIVK